MIVCIQIYYMDCGQQTITFKLRLHENENRYMCKRRHISIVRYYLLSSSIILISVCEFPDVAGPVTSTMLRSSDSFPSPMASSMVFTMTAIVGDPDVPATNVTSSFGGIATKSLASAVITEQII